MKKAKHVTQLKDVAAASYVSRHIAGDVLNGVNTTKSARNLTIIAMADKMHYKCKVLSDRSRVHCPLCYCVKFKVLETRQGGTAWLRIRECSKCNKRFMTKETIIQEKNYL